jgi:hypothetical protein
MTSRIQYSVRGAAVGSGIAPASGAGAKYLETINAAAITTARARPPHLSMSTS